VRAKLHCTVPLHRGIKLALFLSSSSMILYLVWVVLVCQHFANWYAIYFSMYQNPMDFCKIRITNGNDTKLSKMMRACGFHVQRVAAGNQINRFRLHFISSLALLTILYCSLIPEGFKKHLNIGRENMSAYALPGFFPPITYPSPSHSDVGNSSDTTDEASRNVPLHEEDRSTLSTIFRASVDRFYQPLLNASSEPAGKKNTEDKPGIQVKEAKIDPVRLVQCVTQSPRSQSQPSKKSHTRRRNSKERLSDSPQSSPTNRKTTGDEKASCVGTSHDEAIEFELSISFNGRKYTAMRTMQCIVQLRDDLISEMNSKKRWLQMRSSENSFNTADDEDINVQIPEIPPITTGSGFVGRGFTMLHAMVTSYVPAMEGWLDSVMAIVPQDSECLTNFLWEPLPNDLPPMDFTFKSCGSLAPLGSIKELEYNTDDSDSEDEWEG
jgi:hypothetical protein